MGYMWCAPTALKRKATQIKAMSFNESNMPLNQEFKRKRIKNIDLRSNICIKIAYVF